MEAKSLNKAQIEVLNALSVLETEEEVMELKKAISQFFMQRADAELERLKASGSWSDSVLNSPTSSHYRTPYNQ